MAALYRTHRPQNFEQFQPAQPHVVRTLRNAIEMDRVAHAYLFAGPRGTGKTSMAKILAKCLNCVEGPTVTPCLVCESCRAIHDATSIDVIELDAASNRGIDDIREIVDKVALRPAAARRKVYIVDEAHMLTKEASNAVLKTLEEPPEHVVFVLCTTEMQAMLPTIRSRCQRFVFQRPGLPEIGAVLHHVAEAESIDIDPAAIGLIARAAGGSFRDAVSTLDQLSTACDGRIGVADVRELLGTTAGEVLFEIMDRVAETDAAGCLRLVAGQVDAGADLGSLVTDLLGHLRALFLCQQLGTPPEEVAATDDERARLSGQADRLPPATVYRLVDLLRDANDQVREGADPRLPLELALVRICRPAGELELQALEQRIARLEAGLGAGTPPPPPRAPAAPSPSAEPAAADDASATAVAAAPPPPPPPPPLATANPDPQRIPELWDTSIMPEVSRKSKPLAALVANASGVEVKGDTVIVVFPKSKAFARSGTDTPSFRSILSQVLTMAAGGPVGLELTVSDEPEPEDDEPTGEHQRTLSEDEFLTHVKTTFDAREIEEPQR